MKFISYAQNREDVLLWRALQHVTPGFYIDVGANDPSTDSITRSFYERAWCGINIEPHPDFHDRLQRERTRDLNLALAVGAETGTLTLFDVPERRGWASLDQTVALRHRQEGFALKPLPVVVRTLADICSEYVHGEIHFLKIDVEGFEKQVLQGMDFRIWRPWVLLVEATEPGTKITSHQSWEDLILDHHYQFAYFDGINRYYVAEEHSDLLPALSVQANFLDDFVPQELQRAWEAENHANDLALSREALQISLEHLQAKFAAVRASDAEKLLPIQAQLALTEFKYGRALHSLATSEANALQVQTQLQHTTEQLAQSRIEAAQALLDASASQQALEQAEHKIKVMAGQLTESTARAAQLEGHAAELATALDLVGGKCAELTELNQQLQQRLLTLDALLDSIVHSKSWRLTQPLRVLNRYISHAQASRRTRSGES